MSEEIAPESSSASRQKSCQACVKGKRGCDKRYPICSRCEGRNIQCVYVKRTYTEAFYDFDAAELDVSWDEFNALSTPVDDMPPASVDPTCLSNLDSFIDPFSSFAENQSMSSKDMQLITSVENLPDHQPGDEQALSKFDYSPMADLCAQYEPWQVYDPNTKVHFIVKSLKSYPSTFARDNCTPWMHRYLHKDQMPSSIQSCFSVSTLYSNMNSSNKTSVFRVVCQSLNELKRQPSVNTPHEKLARTQALFLYQIIGLFDGDVTLRSNADRNMSLLHDWLDELCKIRENLSVPENMKGQNPPSSWEWWIFAESVRRTIIMAYAFLGLWNVISENNDAAFFRAWQYLHCWTMSRPLWEALSSFDFFQTWKPYHVIESFDLRNFLRTGRVDDVDDFAKVFMVAYMGLDETKKWKLSGLS